MFAALDLAIILTSLSMQHTTLSSFDRLVKESDGMAMRQERVADLRSSLLRLNAPGNDVFETRNVPNELKRFNDEKNIIDDLTRIAAQNNLETGNFKKEVALMSESALNVFKLLGDTSGTDEDKRQRGYSSNRIYGWYGSLSGFGDVVFRRDG